MRHLLSKHNRRKTKIFLDDLMRHLVQICALQRILDGDCLNRDPSFSGSDFLVSLALASIDTLLDDFDFLETILGFLDLGDSDIRGMDGQLIGGSIGFVLGKLVDMDGELFPEDLDDFALGALASSA